MAKPDKVDVYFVLNDPPPAGMTNLTVQVVVSHRPKNGGRRTPGNTKRMNSVRGSPRTFLARNVQLRNADVPPDDRVLVRVTATATVTVNGGPKTLTLAVVDAPSPDHLEVDPVA